MSKETIDAMKKAIEYLAHSGAFSRKSATGVLREAIEREEAQTAEPVAIVTCDGVMGVVFTAASNYGCNLAVGTRLFTHPAPTYEQTVKPIGIVDEGDDGLFVDLETANGVVTPEPRKQNEV